MTVGTRFGNFATQEDGARRVRVDAAFPANVMTAWLVSRYLPITRLVCWGKGASIKHLRQKNKFHVAAEARSGRSSANRALAKQLLKLLEGDRATYRQLQQETSRYRAGDISAPQLRRAFEQALGRGPQASSVLSAVAALLLSGAQQRSLLAALQNETGTELATWRKVEVPQDLKQEQLAALQQRDPLSQRSPMGKRKMPRSKSPEPKKSVKKREEQPSGPKASAGQNVLLWLRMDLRLHDNPALLAAEQRAKALGSTLSFCFIFSPEEDGDELETGTSWRATGAALVWQQAGLKSLDADLQAKYGPGAAIIFKKGPYAKALKEVCDALGVGAVIYARRYEPATRATDEATETALQESGVEVQSVNATLLHEPGTIKILTSGRWVGHFGTLTPFLSACNKQAGYGKPSAAPSQLRVARESPCKQAGGLDVEALEMVKLPVRKDGSVVRWDESILESWSISESAALGILDEFAGKGLQQYEKFRHLADARAVSRLSPYVHFGQLSARHILAVVEEHGGKQVSKTFWRRLVWRDLAYWQLHHWPEMAVKPIRASYEGQDWREDATALSAWQKGCTGFPMVDAGMRQLWQSGWMQQSVRMICALFLTEYLNIHWVHGCRWFHDTLVDADLAINSMMWQNAGKSGLDQWNFTLLPSSSSQDPDGAYVKKWVPELAKLPKKYLHQPWLAQQDVLEAAGVVLGETYPVRITGTTSVQELRKENKEAIREQRRKAAGDWVDGNGYDLIKVPTGSTSGKDGQKIRVFTKRDYRNA